MQMIMQLELHLERGRNLCLQNTTPSRTWKGSTGNLSSLTGFPVSKESAGLKNDKLLLHLSVTQLVHMPPICSGPTSSSALYSTWTSEQWNLWVKSGIYKIAHTQKYLKQAR